MNIKKIPRFPDYSIDEDGAVRKLSTDTEVVPYEAKSGYLGVWIQQKNKRPKYKMVHSLVAAAFLPPRPSKKHLVRHLNGDPHDNRACNLAWGTAKDNAADRVLHNASYGKLSQEDKEAIKFNVTNDNKRDLAKQYNVSYLTIQKIWRDTLK